MEAGTPLAERCVGFGEEPRDRRDQREVDAAAGAVQRLAVCREPLIAPRAGEQLDELGRTIHPHHVM